MNRYLEIVHPIWHKTHFQIRWLYTIFIINWLVGIGFNAAYHIPTTQVSLLFFRDWPSDYTSISFCLSYKVLSIRK